MQTITELATMHASSSFYKGLKAEDLAAKMALAQSIGLEPQSALLGSIHFIQSNGGLKIELSAKTMGGLIRKSDRYDYTIERYDYEICVISFEKKRDNQWLKCGEMSYSRSDAERAGLWGKENWRKYPREMLFARCLSHGFRAFCPDLADGMIYTDGEIEPDRKFDPTDAPAPKVIDVKPSQGQWKADGIAWMKELAAQFNGLTIQPPDIWGATIGLMKEALKTNKPDAFKRCKSVMDDEIEVGLTLAQQYDYFIKQNADQLPDFGQWQSTALNLFNDKEFDAIEKLFENIDNDLINKHFAENEQELDDENE